MPSFPEAFQLGIFLHCFVTLSIVMTTLSWGCLSFPSSFLRSFSHSAFPLCSSPILQTSKYHPKIFYFLQHLYIIWFYPTSIELWSKSKILFCLNCSILCSYLLTKHSLQASFASILHLQFSVLLFLICIFHLIYLICVFSSIPVLP